MMMNEFAGTVRSQKRGSILFAAAVLLLVCVLAVGAVSAADIVTVSNFAALQNNISTSDDLTIIVTDDISISNTLTIDSGKNITLRADGTHRTLSRDGFTGNLFRVNSSGNLTITGYGTSNLTLDGTGQASNSLVYVNGGSFTLADGGILTNNMVPSSSGGGVYVNNSGTLTMSGGEISNNTAYTGGGVYLNGGTFTMESGTISNNDYDATSGGGVYVKDGTFTMSGGTITNHMVRYGGGVYVENGEFTMSGTAKISNNTAEIGGGVDLNGGTFTMSGGTISKNKANEWGWGGGVYVSGGTTFTMKTGEISGNTASSSGGGVYLNRGTFEMESGTISDNTATSGGGVYVNYDGEFEMSSGTISKNKASEGGGVDLNGKLTMSGGTITDNEADTNGTGVYVGGVFNIQKSGTVNGVYLPDGKNITVTGTLNDDTAVTGIIPKMPKKDLLVVDLASVSEDYLTKFTLDDSVENFALKYQQAGRVGLVLTPTTHTVTFEENGGTSVPDKTVNHGDTVDKPDDPTKDGHTFAGWHKDTACTQPWDFNDGITGDMTLYAKWTPNKPVPPSGGVSSDGNMDNAYRVLFNDGATTLYIVTDLSAGDKLTKPEDPVKDGYTFAGWHKDSACTQAWDFNDGITGDMTLYAKWTPQETVTPTATATPTVTATATATATPTGNASPAPTVQPDNNGNNGDTTATSGISLSYLIGGILILLLAILLLLILLLRHTVTFLIPTGGELEEYRIKVWHGRYINTEDLPDLIRTAAWYRDPARQERWDFDQDRVTKSIELYLG